MKVGEWVFLLLVISVWALEDAHHLFPSMTDVELLPGEKNPALICPFPFSDTEIAYRWYVFDISNYLRLIIFAIGFLILKIKVHWIIRDVVILTLIMLSFSLIWYLTFYGNPFYKSELWVKGIVAGGIYGIIFIGRKWKLRKSRSH